MAFSCTKTEYIEVPIEVPVHDTIVIHDSLIIKVKKDDTGYYGASGYVNGNYKEFQGAEFFKNYSDTSKFIVIIANFEWLGNILWAARQVIDINNFDIGFNINDTLSLSQSLEETFSRVYHMYQDGDTGAECYEIFNTQNFDSWFLITEYNEEVGEIAGTIHADYVISDVCPPKYDPTQPDTIRIRDFWFRAKLRE
jgi:hypothetical protein